MLTHWRDIDCHLNAEEEAKVQPDPEADFEDRLKEWEQIQHFMQISKESEKIDPPRKFRSNLAHNHSGNVNQCYSITIICALVHIYTVDLRLGEPQ